MAGAGHGAGAAATAAADHRLALALFLYQAHDDRGYYRDKNRADDYCPDILRQPCHKIISF